MKHLKKFNENIIDYHAENVDRFIRELGRLGNTLPDPFDPHGRNTRPGGAYGPPPGIPLTRLEVIANDCDIEVVNYNQFFYDLPEDQRKTAPPRFNPGKREGMPVFALVNPKTKKQRLVVSVPMIDRQMIDMITHMLKHETVHVGQHAKRPAYDKPLPDPKNSKDYFGDTDEVMAYAQSIVDILVGQEGATSVEDGIKKLQSVRPGDKNGHLGHLWNKIKESVDKGTLKKYMKYIYQYLELEFGTKPGKMGSKVAKKVVDKRPDPVHVKKVNERPSKAALMARLSGKK